VATRKLEIITAEREKRQVKRSKKIIFLPNAPPPPNIEKGKENIN